MSRGLLHIMSTVPKILGVWKCHRDFDCWLFAGRDREKEKSLRALTILKKKDFLFGFNTDRLFPLWTYVNGPHLLVPSKCFFLACCLLGSMGERVQVWGSGEGGMMWVNRGFGLGEKSRFLKGTFYPTLIDLGWIFSSVSTCMRKLYLAVSALHPLSS